MKHVWRMMKGLHVRRTEPDNPYIRPPYSPSPRYSHHLPGKTSTPEYIQWTFSYTSETETKYEYEHYLPDGTIKAESAWEAYKISPGVNLYSL